MEDFYRASRQRFQVLMEGHKPVGGNWNFDKENRQPPKGKLNTPKPLWFEPDAITQEVLGLAIFSPLLKTTKLVTPKSNPI